MRCAIVVSVFLGVACGPAKSPAPNDPVVVGNTSIDAGAPLAPGCPAAWGSAGQGCDVTSGATCTYAEGWCSCGVERPCSGVDLGDDWARDIPPTWQCTERPPDFRDDGCPGVEPTGACWTEGQKCSYGSCCFQELTCTSGAWEITGGGCPP